MVDGVDLTDTTCPSGNACTACNAGQYKNQSGTAACNVCPIGLSSGIGSTSSSVCNSNPCNAGFTGPNGGPCIACATGKYKTTTGTAVCADCAAGRYSTTSGATTCIDCAVGTYSTTVGSNVPTTCINCGVSLYSAVVGTSTCLTCPANSGASCTTCYTPACPCKAGYTGGNFISQYSTNGCSRFHALMTWKPSFASVSTRKNAGIGTIPTYNAVGGPTGKGHVNFNSTNDQWLSTGARTFNIDTNGGFTLVIVMRWTGVMEAGQHICTSGNPRTWEIFRQSSTVIEFLWWSSNNWWRVSRGQQ
jgi:hypothetical protein